MNFTLRLREINDETDDPESETVKELTWEAAPNTGDYLDVSDGEHAYVVTTRFWNVDTGRLTVYARAIA